MAFRIVSLSGIRWTPVTCRSRVSCIRNENLWRTVRNCSTTTSGQTTSTTSGPAQVSDCVPAEDIEKLKKLLDEKNENLETFQSKVNELEDKYKRSLAETENVRQRLFKQIEEAKVFGIQSFSKDLLEVADVLRKAIDSVPKTPSQLEEGKVLQSLQEGLQLTEAQLLKVFQKNGLEQVVPSEGDDFDPDLHEALFQVPGGKAGKVAQLSQIGYRLRGRTIRPAKVGVFKQ